MGKLTYTPKMKSRLVTTSWQVVQRPRDNLGEIAICGSGSHTSGERTYLYRLSDSGWKRLLAVWKWSSKHPISSAHSTTSLIHMRQYWKRKTIYGRVYWKVWHQKPGTRQFPLLRKTDCAEWQGDIISIASDNTRCRMSMSPSAVPRMYSLVVDVYLYICFFSRDCMHTWTVWAQ